MAQSGASLGRPRSTEGPLVRHRSKFLQLVSIKWTISLLSGIRGRSIRVYFCLVLDIALWDFESIWILSDMLMGALGYKCQHGGMILNFEKITFLFLLRDHIIIHNFRVHSIHVQSLETRFLAKKDKMVFSHSNLYTIFKVPKRCEIYTFQKLDFSTNISSFFADLIPQEGFPVT